LEPSDSYFQIISKTLPGFDPDKHLFYKGKGCNQCGNTGYARRIALHEVLMLNPELRSLISQNVPSGVLKEAAVKHGMKALFDDGLAKALEGRTTLEEVIRTAYTIE
jgi:type II secretory ATPase GspE/PulE/Tfp pilus assembly ATPase PilB-like protein